MTFREQIQRDEGFRAQAYPDFTGDANRKKIAALWQEFLNAGGTVAVGYGRNLTMNPLSQEEASYLLDHDLAQIERNVIQALPWAAHLDAPRQAVLFNMAYNLGLAGLLGFRKMLAAVERQDWNIAKLEILDSRLPEQIGERAARLAKQMYTGEWQ